MICVELYTCFYAIGRTFFDDGRRNVHSEPTMEPCNSVSVVR